MFCWDIVVRCTRVSTFTINAYYAREICARDGKYESAVIYAYVYVLISEPCVCMQKDKWQAMTVCALDIYEDLTHVGIYV